MYVREKLIGVLKAAQLDSVDKCHSYEECESCPNNGMGILCRVPFSVDFLISRGVTVQDVTDMNVRSKDWSDGFKRGYEDGYKVDFNADKWIPFDDVKPKDGQSVLGITTEGEMEVYQFDANWQTCLCQFNGSVKVFNITHWMPLPQQPKGE